MTLDECIYNELKNILPLYPLDAKPSNTDDYGIYSTVTDDEEKTLSGYIGLITEEKEIDIMSKSYSQVKSIYKQLKDKIKTFQSNNIGVFVQDITFGEGSFELWEDQIGMYRKILNFSITYQI